MLDRQAVFLTKLIQHRINFILCGELGLLMGKRLASAGVEKKHEFRDLASLEKVTLEVWIEHFTAPGFSEVLRDMMENTLIDSLKQKVDYYISGRVVIDDSITVWTGKPDYSAELFQQAFTKAQMADLTTLFAALPGLNTTHKGKPLPLQVRVMNPSSYLASGLN